jgi:hypothetical protein
MVLDCTGLEKTKMITREFAKERAFESDWYLVQAFNANITKQDYRQAWESKIVTDKQIDKMFNILTELEAAE